MFFAAIIITIDENNEGDETAQAQMSGLLITVVVAPFLAMLWYIIKEFRSELNKDVKAIQGISSRPPSKSSAENSWETSRLSSNAQLPRFSSNVAQDGRSVEMVSIDGDESTGAYSARLSSAKRTDHKMAQLTSFKVKSSMDGSMRVLPLPTDGGLSLSYLVETAAAKFKTHPSMILLRSEVDRRALDSDEVLASLIANETRNAPIRLILEMLPPSKVDADAAAEEYPEGMGGGDGDFSSDFSVGLRMSDNPMKTRMSSKPTRNKAASTPVAAEDAIEKLKDADGNVYFHDRQSGSTAWTRDEVCVTLSLL